MKKYSPHLVKKMIKSFKDEGGVIVGKAKVVKTDNEFGAPKYVGGRYITAGTVFASTPDSRVLLGNVYGSKCELYFTHPIAMV